MFGGKYGIPCGLAFFGADHIVFATDTPLGPIAPTIAVIDGLDIDEEARRKIYVGNAERLVKRKLG
jgi:aminocarboxymuconate-semialdehyde decarboxylase